MYMSFFSVGLGAALGAWLRWGISIRFNSFLQNIPLGTVIVNLLGGFIIGFAVSFFATSSIGPNYRLFLITGFCGALTTFSTFSIEVVYLLQNGKLEYAALTILVHVLGSLLFTILGMFAFRLLVAN